MNVSVIVGVSVLIDTAHCGVEVRYAAPGFLMQPDGGFTAFDIGFGRQDPAILVLDFLPVKFLRKVKPELFPVLRREVLGVFGSRAYLYTDKIVFSRGWDMELSFIEFQIPDGSIPGGRLLSQI